MNNIEYILEKFIDYLKLQRNYSDYTCINYSKDIEEYIYFLKENNLKYDKIDYNKCIKYLNYLNNKNNSKTSISRKLS